MNIFFVGGLSGSDDVLWASLVLAEHPSFIDVEYQWNGGRGAKQLYAEAERHYVHTDSQNHTLLFWDTNKKYTATISVTLWIAASARLYEVMPDEPRYLHNALSSLDALTFSPDGDPQNALLTADGHVYDGRSKNKNVPNRFEWSYNAGAALGALSSLFRTTGERKFLDQAEAVAKQSVQVFFGSSGVLHEQRAVLNDDQKSFKGIYLYYLRDFCRTRLQTAPAGEKPPEWIVKLRKTALEHSQWLVANRLTPQGFCAFWGELDAQTSCESKGAYVPQGMMTASQLFNLALFLKENVPES